MSKSGTFFSLILLFVISFSSCRDKSASKIEQGSSNPEAKNAYASFMELLENDSIINDSLLKIQYTKALSLLETEGQLLLDRKMGEYYYNNEIPDTALIYFRKGLELARKVKHTYYTAVFHLACGSVYTFISDFEPALIELKAAYNISSTIDSLNLQIRTSRNLGNVYWNIGNYDLALDYYLISLEISQKANNQLGIASALNNIGNVYQEVKNYDRAIDYYKRSEMIAESEDFSRVIAITNNNLGDVFSIKGKYDSALIYFKKALDEVKKVESRFDAGIYIGNLADLYLKTDSLEKSKEYFFESLHYAEGTGDKTGIASCNLGLAEVHLKDNNPTLAEEFLLKGIKVSEEIGSLKLMEYGYRLYSSFYFQKGDYPNSHFFLSRQMFIKDSIYSLENGENVARLENQYKEVQSIKQIELLKEKQKSFLYLSVLGFSAFLIISLLIYTAYRQKNKSNKLLKEKNLEIEASRLILEEKNQQLISSQDQLSRINKGKDIFLTVISHDLKNPLSSIRGFTELLLRSYDSFTDEQRKNFLVEVFNSIENLSLLINNILFWAKSQTNGLHFKTSTFNLNKRIEENISIYLLMLSNKQIHVENTVSDSLNVVSDSNVFDMIFRNILSNALKFTPEKGNISIHCEQTGSKIKISVSDSGKGIPEDKIKVILDQKESYSTDGTGKEHGTGLGLGLIQWFLEQTGESFEIESKLNQGTTIRFTLSAAN